MLAMIFYCGFYKSNPFSDPLRAGWVAYLSNSFCVYFRIQEQRSSAPWSASDMRSSITCTVLSACLVVVGANVHAIGYVYKWSLAGQLSTELAQPYIRWAFVGLACVDLLRLRIHPIRQVQILQSLHHITCPWVVCALVRRELL
ncbi:hypothetical protein EDD16DRAFT_1213817 [Pisolithus croceorrhizus]|nr:hypothetical protein EDD16DRAFT_1213817 [Pisolithus croceorrhizus]